MKRLYTRHSGLYTVSELCGLFGKSKQAYYKHDADLEMRRRAIEELTVRYIVEVREKDPGIGGLKIWIMYVREFGRESAIGRDRFCEIFDRYGYKLRRRKRAPRTTDSTHGNPTYPNLTKALIPTRLGELIVSDITYIPLIDAITGERTFCYASLVLDSYSKILLGYSVGPTLETTYPLEALYMAIEVLSEHRVDLSETIHHSDRGTQYTSADYIEVLHQHKIRISMTETGNPKDNPEAERINNTIKNELLKDKVFHNIEEVREAMASAVSFYNRERPHRSIEMLTPFEAATRTGRFKRGWKSYRELAIDKNLVENTTAKDFL